MRAFLLAGMMLLSATLVALPAASANEYSCGDEELKQVCDTVVWSYDEVCGAGEDGVCKLLREECEGELCGNIVCFLEGVCPGINPCGGGEVEPVVYITPLVDDCVGVALFQVRAAGEWAREQLPIPLPLP